MKLFILLFIAFLSAPTAFADAQVYLTVTE